MDKINKIVKSFTEEEFEELLTQISANNADKSSMLLRFGRTRNYTDKEVIEKLDINANAFYTLKSRLNHKIEGFLVQKMEAPKLELIRKVSYASDIILNTDPEITSVMLKRLEKELLDYDLPYELTKIYQNLKKIHIAQPQQHYQYSQLYNKHVAYTLALDKAEDMIGLYFKTYSQYYLSRTSIDLQQLYIIIRELENICKLYASHRLYVYDSIVRIFHTLFVPDEKGDEKDIFSLDENFDQLDEIFSRYNKDSFYLLVRPVFDFHRFEFYHLSGQKVKALNELDDINAEVIGLLQYFKFYTFPSLFLMSKLEIYASMGREKELAQENLESLVEHEPSTENVGAFLNYHIYLAVSSYYEGSFEVAARILQDARNEISFKGLTHIDIEIKLLLALQYAHLNEFELTGQLIKSIQRQVRNAEGKDYEDASMFIKMLNKLANGQPDKAQEYLDKFNELKRNEDSVVPYLRVKTDFFRS